MDLTVKVFSSISGGIGTRTGNCCRDTLELVSQINVSDLPRQAIRVNGRDIAGEASQ
jgi:hypothetical protein